MYYLDLTKTIHQAHLVMTIPIYLLSIMTQISGSITLFILIIYFKLRFDQINVNIKSLIPNGRVISRSRGRQLIRLIDEHNSVAIQVHQANLVCRRFFAAVFIYLALVKIIPLYYLLLKTSDFMQNVMAIYFLIIVMLMGYVMTFMLTQQIKSAHQSLRLIYSVVCRYKMEFRLRLKVKLHLKIA